MQVLDKPVNWRSIKAEPGISMIILVEVDSPDFKVNWQASNINLCDLIYIANEYVFDNYRRTPWVLAIDTHIELLEA